MKKKKIDKNDLKKVHISRGGGGVKANSEKVHNFFFFFDPSLKREKHVDTTDDDITAYKL